jgi:hypothetical protein
MTREMDPQYLSLPDLIQRCEHETKLYFRRQEHDSRYCFELFRRAIQGGDQSIWGNIYSCYSGLVASWVKQHPGFESSGEPIEYFVNGAFGKLAVTLKRERFQGFSGIGFVLSYLKLCVHSVIVDYQRAADRTSSDPWEGGREKTSPEPSPEQQVMERSGRQEIWERVNQRLHNEKERVVLRGLFVYDLKPRELYDQFPAMFKDVDEIYTIKQNILARLRRDPEIRKLLGPDD